MCEIKIGTKVRWVDEDKTLKEGYDEETVYDILDEKINKENFNIREKWLKKYYNLKVVKGIGKVKSIEIISKDLSHIEIITLFNGRIFGRRNGIEPSALKVVKGRSQK